MSGLKERFTQIRKEKKMTATAVSIKMGVSLPALYSYFNGQPHLDNLMNIAKALDVPLMRLIDEPEPTNTLQEPPVAFEVTKQPTDMNYDDYKEADATQKELIALQREKIEKLERELKQCQEADRVLP